MSKQIEIYASEIDPENEDQLLKIEKPRGLTLDQAYLEVGGWGKFHFLFLTPLILIYPVSLNLWYAIPLLEKTPDY